MKPKTIGKPVTVEGLGLFGGKNCSVTFRPAESACGISFVRTDIDPRVTIPAHIDFLRETDRRTELVKDSASVETVEHVLSAVYGLGITDLVIEVTSAELCNTDGSAAIFCDALVRAGVVAMPGLVNVLNIDRPVTLSHDDAVITALPGEGEYLDIIYALDYSQMPSIGRQLARFRLGADDYAHQIAPARTFLLDSEVKAIRDMGIGLHLSEKDFLVFTPDGPVGNKTYWPDEPARHKVCDLIGDLCLAGRPLSGRIIAFKSGHLLNHRLVKALLEQ